MINRLICILLLCVSIANAQGGEIRYAQKNKYNPEYRVNYFDKMIFKIDINSDVNEYVIPKLDFTDIQNSFFKPNQSNKLRFSFDYKFLGLAFSISPSFLSENTNSKKVNTKTLDLSFKFFYSDRLRQEVVFKKTKGFYLENPELKETTIVFNDLEINEIGGKTFFIVNRNFSFRSFDSQTEKQLKGAGSLIPCIDYRYNKLATNTVENDESYLTQINSLDVFLKLGYMYNFVLSENWFVTPGLHSGLGLNITDNFFYDPTQNIDFKTHTNDIKTSLDIDISLGYNGRNLFTGFKLFSNQVISNNNSITPSKTYTSFYFGYRFKENKRIKKQFEYVEKKLGL